MSCISVIVPVYKIELFLERCVDSILAQTYTDFKLILVDDGSPDLCPAICDAYVASDRRVTVIHQENGGLSQARNAGIEFALADPDCGWITFVDGDDWVHAEYLARLYHAAVKHGAGISSCKFLYAKWESDIQISEPAESAAEAPEAFYCSERMNAVVAWGKLYAKELFDEIRFPQGKLHEDEFVTYRLLFQCETIAAVQTPLYFLFSASGRDYCKLEACSFRRGLCARRSMRLF